MQMNETDKGRLLEFYEDSLQQYGDHDARSVHWTDERNQRVRFEILLCVTHLNGKTVLDVGCGLGDLYKLLKEKDISVNYTGIDIVPDFISKAQEHYPEAIFKCQDIFDIEETCDVIIASGA